MIESYLTFTAIDARLFVRSLQGKVYLCTKFTKTKQKTKKRLLKKSYSTRFACLLLFHIQTVYFVLVRWSRSVRSRAIHHHTDSGYLVHSKCEKNEKKIFIFFAESNSKQGSVNDYLATYRAARQSTRRKFQSFQLTPWGKTTKTSITVQFEIAFSLQDCNFTKYKLLFKSPSET